MNDGKSPYSHYLIALAVIVIAALAFAYSEGYASAGKATAYAANSTNTTFDFSISASPAGALVEQGKTASTTATVKLITGPAEKVVLSYTRCPPSAMCSFAPSSGFPTYNSTFKVATKLSTPPGTYRIILTGKGGNKTKSAIFTLTVTKNSTNTTFDFSLFASPSSGFVEKGKSVSTSISAILLSGTPETVSLSQTGCPAGAACTFTPSSGKPTFSSTLAINTTASTSPGTYLITIKGTSPSRSKTTTYTLTVTGNATNTTFDFSISASPASGSVARGGAATSTTTVTLITGPTQNVTLSRTGCPPSSACTFAPSSGKPTYTSTFKVTTTLSTPIGTYPITIIGTSSAKTMATTYTLTVTNISCVRATPAVAISPLEQSGTSGKTLNYTTTVTNMDSSGCGNSTFDMTYLIPATWSASFSPASLAVSSGASKTTTFSITSSTNSTKGNYTFTNIATNRISPTFKGSANATYKVI
ncbi:MAG: hypothetical protein HY513_02565 [Candidatus Aenigmarchaeota archaeon]|nr:hypothetical protein [Candidatus Aenigmarchaeota archaeon]